MRVLPAILRYAGFADDGVGHGERLASALGGFVGICLVGVISRWWLDNSPAAVLIMGSMGSSAVLLFAVPHGKLSQPWALVGGHAVSAVAGVAMARQVPDPVLAAALAVGLAIALMHYARCIHPPGGATALTAVVGGDAVQGLGWQFVATPVVLNTLAILAAAVLFNALFPWRRYPAALGRPATPAAAAPPATATDAALPADAVAEGYCYSNDDEAPDWAVREVVTVERHANPLEDTVTFRVVAGRGRGTVGRDSRERFAAWARWRLRRTENVWHLSPPRAI